MRARRKETAPPTPAPIAAAPSDDDRLRCPRCECPHLCVLEKRGSVGNRARRRRECRNCGHRFTTFEAVADEPD